MLEGAKLRRKTGQGGLLISSYRRLKKDSDRAITPAVEAVSVPAHLAPPKSLQAKQMHHLHTQLSLGQSCHRQKCFVSMHAGSLWSCPALCDPVDYGLPGFSWKSKSQHKNPLFRELSHNDTCEFTPCFSRQQPVLLLAQTATVLQLHHHKAHKSAAKRAATDVKVPLQPITRQGQAKSTTRVSPRS